MSSPCLEFAAAWWWWCGEVYLNVCSNKHSGVTRARVAPWLLHFSSLSGSMSFWPCTQRATWANFRSAALPAAAGWKLLSCVGAFDGNLHLSGTYAHSTNSSNPRPLACCWFPFVTPQWPKPEVARRGTSANIKFSCKPSALMWVENYIHIRLIQRLMQNAWKNYKWKKGNLRFFIRFLFLIPYII